MNLIDIKGKATIIAESYLHPMIRKRLLEKNSAIGNVDIISLENWMRSQTIEADDDLDYLYFKKLQGMSLEHFKQMSKTGAFISEIKEFITIMKHYGITADRLPETDGYLSELKMMVSELYELETTVEKKLEVFNEFEDFTGFYIIDYCPSLFHQRLYRKMIEKGARKIERDLVEPEKKFYYVLNKKEEVEALARYIIENKINVDEAKLTVTERSYKPFVRQIFNRYEIPFYFVDSTSRNKLSFKFNALIEYYLDQGTDNLLRLFDEEVFTLRYSDCFCEYVRVYDKTLDDSFDVLKYVEESGDIINKQELSYLKRLEEKANEIRNTIKTSLDELISLDFDQALEKIDEIICDNHIFKSKEDLQVLNQIRKEIRIAYPYVDRENCELLEMRINDVKVNHHEDIHGLSVANLHSMLGSYKYHFMLGANSDLYPGFSTLNGIFSENYVRLFDFPSQEERYGLYEQQSNENLRSSKYFVAFYSTASFDGKEKQAALDIENFCNEESAKYFPTDFYKKEYQIKHQLDKNIAKALFTKDNVIYGSVSSLENYANCHFKYFLKSGLGILEPNDYSFNNAKLGTLMHYVFEILCKEYKKEYGNQTNEVIKKILDKKIEEVLKIYPRLKDEFIVLKAQLLSNIDLNLRFMSDMENDKILEPSEYEKPFDYEIALENGIKLSLHGFIDRIDSNDQFLEIIDYKSSKHELKLEEVLTCIKLQLLTYLVASCRKSGKKAAGAYYYNFGNSMVSGQFAKANFSKKEINEYDRDYFTQQFMNSKKLCGWTFTENFEVIDKGNKDGSHGTLKHIAGVSINNNGEFSSKTNIYDIVGVEELLLTIYKVLTDDICNGDISIEPINCKFCKYKTICHYKGNQIKREPLENSDSIYHKKAGGGNNNGVE